VGRSKWAIYKMRERFERASGRMLPRHERRGRKPRRNGANSATIQSAIQSAPPAE
jgi:hypothetical protein